MNANDYFLGASGTRYTYSAIADRIRKKAPHTLGKHIFVQLAAIGLLDEFTSGTTPSGLPYTFAEASDEAQAAKYTPGPWEVSGDRDDSDGLCVVQQATGGLLCLVESTPGYAAADEATARLIATAPELLDACTAALERMAKSYRHTFDSRMDNDPLVIQLRRALANAGGIPLPSATDTPILAVSVRGGLIDGLDANIPLTVLIEDWDVPDQDTEKNPTRSVYTLPGGMSGAKAEKLLQRIANP